MSRDPNTKHVGIQILIANNNNKLKGNLTTL